MRTKRNAPSIEPVKNIEDSLPDAVREFFDIILGKISSRATFAEIVEHIKGFLQHYHIDLDRRLSNDEWLYLVVMTLMILKNNGLFIPDDIKHMMIEEAAKRKFRKRDIKFHLKELVDAETIEKYFPKKPRNRTKC